MLEIAVADPDPGEALRVGRENAVAAAPVVDAMHEHVGAAVAERQEGTLRIARDHPGNGQPDGASSAQAVAAWDEIGLIEQQPVAVDDDAGSGDLQHCRLGWTRRRPSLECRRRL